MESSKIKALNETGLASRSEGMVRDAWTTRPLWPGRQDSLSNLQLLHQFHWKILIYPVEKVGTSVLSDGNIIKFHWLSANNQTTFIYSLNGPVFAVRLTCASPGPGSGGAAAMRNSPHPHPSTLLSLRPPPRTPFPLPLAFSYNIFTIFYHYFNLICLSSTFLCSNFFYPKKREKRLSPWALQHHQPVKCPLTPQFHFRSLFHRDSCACGGNAHAHSAQVHDSNASEHTCRCL